MIQYGCCEHCQHAPETRRTHPVLCHLCYNSYPKGPGAISVDTAMTRPYGIICPGGCHRYWDSPVAIHDDHCIWCGVDCDACLAKQTHVTRSAY